MLNLKTNLSVLAVVIVLLACGGGGGDGSSISTNSVLPPVSNPPSGTTTSQTWKTPVLIDVNLDLLSSSSPQIALAPSGDAISVWPKYFNTQTVWANQYRASTKNWARPEQINTGEIPQGAISTPKIGMDAKGNVMAVWLSIENKKVVVLASRYVANSNWDKPVQIGIQSGNNNIDSKLEIAVDSQGNAIAVWYQSVDRGDGIFVYRVWANRYSVNVGWGVGVPITTIPTADSSASAAGDPTIAVDAVGNAFVAWAQIEVGGKLDNNGSPLFNNIWASRYTVGAGWGVPEKIEINNDEGSGDPKIAMDPNGNAIVAWLQSDRIKPQTYWANRYKIGVGWGTSQLIQNPSVSSISAFNKPNIAMDSNGNAIALWLQPAGRSGTVDKLWYNKYVVDTDWGVAQQISSGTDPLTTYFDPGYSLGFDSSGQAIAVWTQGTNNTSYVWASRYTNTTGWSSAVQLENDTVGSARSPQVALNAAGKAIAVWSKPSNNAQRAIWASSFD